MRRAVTAQMRSRSLNISDKNLALVIGVVGAALMAYGAMTHRAPFNALPGLGGAMTMGLLGYIFALLHGISFRQCLWVMAPVVIIQIVGGMRYGASSMPAQIGIELTVFAAIGLVLMTIVAASKRRTA